MTTGDWRPARIIPAAVGVAPTAEGLLSYLDCVDVTALLAGEKAVLFRGFHIGRDALEDVMSLVVPDRVAHVPGYRPRTRVAHRVYLEPDGAGLHHELGDTARPPRRVMLYCELASGGATAVVDSAGWLRALDPEVRAAFAAGIRYHHRLCHAAGGAHRSWPEAFDTDDRAAVESCLTAEAASWEWTADGLHINQWRPATVRHPVTGTEVWFTEPAGRPPASVTFDDGTAIPDEYLRQVRAIGYAAAVELSWQAGDLFLLDNVLVAHGRRRPTGHRRLLLAMAH
jgi:alpha-ketoglutarate-dependent taurine dioxygenase